MNPYFKKIILENNGELAQAARVVLHPKSSLKKLPSYVVWITYTYTHIHRHTHTHSEKLVLRDNKAWHKLLCVRIAGNKVLYLLATHSIQITGENVPSLALG